MLAPEIERTVRAIALGRLSRDLVGQECPLGAQLEIAAQYSHGQVECGFCRGRGEYTDPAGEERKCRRCQGSGMRWRATRHVRPSQGLAMVWPYIYVPSRRHLEPSYEMAVPRSGPLYRRVERAVDSLPDLDRMVLCDYYADQDLDAPDPIARVALLTTRGRAMVARRGVATTLACSDLYPEARELLDAAKRRLAELL